MGNEKKSEKPVQESSIQRLKKQYPDGLNFSSGRFGHKKIGVNRFVVQEADGLRFVEEKDDAFVLVKKVSWHELPQRLYMDKLFLKAFYYSDEKETNSVFTLSRADDGDEICREIEQRKQVTLKKRKGIQKIVGFRSGSVWKSAIAISFYALMLFFVIGLFTGNDDEAVAKPTAAKEERAVKTEKEKEKESKQIAESKESKSTSTSLNQEPKKDSVKQLYKKLGNDFIFKTTQVDKNGSALNESHHTINMRVSTTMGSAKQIRSQAQYLAAQILKESFKKDKKLDQLVLFVDYDKDIRIVKYVFDKNSLDLIKQARTSDGDVWKEHVEQYASSKIIHPDAK